LSKGERENADTLTSERLICPFYSLCSPVKVAVLTKSAFKPYMGFGGYGEITGGKFKVGTFVEPNLPHSDPT